MKCTVHRCLHEQEVENAFPAGSGTWSRHQWHLTALCHFNSLATYKGTNCRLRKYRLGNGQAREAYVQGFALGTGSVTAQSFLPALVACHALHLVIDAVAIAVIAVLEQLPVCA